MAHPRYSERFNHGLGYRPETEFRYIGGDSDSHAKWWVLNMEDTPMPGHKDHCLCGHDIQKNCYIQHMESKEILVVGSCCITRFMTHSGRTCSICQAPHKNRMDALCNDCRGGKLTCGKYKGRTFQSVYEEDIEYCSSIIKYNHTAGMGDFVTWLFTKSHFGDDWVFDPANGTVGDPYNFREPEGTDILPYGKYAGYTCDYVLRHDPDYCRWVIKNITDGDLEMFKDWLLTQEIPVIKKVVNGQTILNIGKHKGKSYDSIKNRNPGYCAWVLKQTETTTTELKEFQTWLSNPN